MAYNLQSLLTILQQILDPQQTCWKFDHNKPQLQSLFEKVESLLQILEKPSLTNILPSKLESRIRDASYKAEDIIESHMVYQKLSNPQSPSLTFSTPDLQQVTEELDLAMEQVQKLMERKKTISTSLSSSSGASSSHDVQLAIQQLESVNLVEVVEKKMPALWTSKNNLVGVDADMLQLKDRLTNMQTKLEIIPITGMGGIGKSTLARNLYDDRLIISHFDYRGWAAISQLPNMRDILLSLLRRPDEKIDDELNGCNEDELKDILYQRLFGRRYMIVLDDIWSTKFWDEIRMYLPNNNNRSRVVITTREAHVAQYIVNSKSLHHDMQLLNMSASWDLLRQIVFGEEDCPLDFQWIGIKIASECGGLPLAIQVIGGLLSKVERSIDAWKHLSTDVRASIVESEERFSNILSLSYNHLPIYLKPCFLYMGAFPEDSKIKGSRLMRLWIAEGFVKSIGDKSLEEEAKDYLKLLVERNLLLVTQKKQNGKALSYSVHDLLRDLCIRKANEEKFLHVKNSMRRVSVESSYDMEDVCASPQLMSLARSFICTSDKINVSPVLCMLRLVRILDIMGMLLEEFPEEILQLVNLRYLAINCSSGLPDGMSRLHNLQTLICPHFMRYVTSELWEMYELIHIKFAEFIMKIKKIKFDLKKLQTLYIVWITPKLISSGFFEGIPNIIKLGIYYEDSPNIEVDLSHLHKLEILLCESQLDKDGSRFLHTLRFPSNLRKLSLLGCVVFRSLLTTLCTLPNLEVLRIMECPFEREGETAEEEEEEWEVTEGDQFRSRLFLLLQFLNLVRWKANEPNFPKLRKLHVLNCNRLEEIPSAIGDISTLQEISIVECGASIVASAQQIIKEQQEEYDNFDLKLYIR
ncbi:putative late blight resistance protein homolog R1B-16 [Salvia splendens]|uniref:putative late blight resistance protein homolog R1B-16 n=1 Tax=Salvia splendens TaxID=180675 RepID=UPI001C2719F6|nr:putative late blight resistance protein homolog R1B-16 [Salvia splendens]XP_042030521.1 putative late blight resistance protein homolog R1B-16 [Salvia splendens]XP_042030522.1 putative late blight resistance protein homolog R1B-16 [Salvia splendens]